MTGSWKPNRERGRLNARAPRSPPHPVSTPSACGTQHFFVEHASSSLSSGLPVGPALPQERVRGHSIRRSLKCVREVERGLQAFAIGTRRTWPDGPRRVKDLDPAFGSSPSPASVGQAPANTQPPREPSPLFHGTPWIPRFYTSKVRPSPSKKIMTCRKP